MAAQVGSTFALGTVTDLGRGGLQCSDPTEPLRLQRPWRVEYCGVTPTGAPCFMSTEEVAKAITLREAVSGVAPKTTTRSLATEEQQGSHGRLTQPH